MLLVAPVRKDRRIPEAAAPFIYPLF